MWITNQTFASLSPINVFKREHSGDAPAPSPVQNAHILFRRAFELGTFEKAVLKISADDRYECFIGGKYVACGVAQSYTFAYYYNEIDVTGFLKAGKNLLAVHTWYDGQINRANVSGDNLHGLWLELTVDGETVLTSDETFLVTTHTGYRAIGEYGYKTGFLEEFDAGAPEVGFERPDYDDTAWDYATENPNGKCYTFVGPAPVLEHEYLTPAVCRQDGNRVFIDFGRETVGVMSFAAVGNKGSRITVRIGEELNPDGTVRFDMRCNCRMEETVILSGKDDVFTWFDARGVRYAELLLPDGCRFDTTSVIFRAGHFPYREAVDLTCRDKKLEEVFRLCADTVKYGVLEVAVDCPTREKGQYLGDTGYIGMVHAELTGEAVLLKKAMRDFARSAFICPGLMAVAPASYAQEIADYSLSYPWFCLFAYEKDGDTAFLREVYPAVLGVYDYFKKVVNEDYLLADVTEPWNLVDWPANLRDDYDFDLSNPPPKGIHNVLNASFIAMMKTVEEIAAILGEPSPCKELLPNAEAAFIKTFYDEKRGLFRDTPTSDHFAIHSSILPLVYDIGCTEDVKRNVLAFIREKRLCSMNYFAYNALLAVEKCGDYALLKDLITDDSAWRNMLSEGATACFEAWGKDKKWNTSLCHPWMSYAILFRKHIQDLA
ncbi:MAG: family 78 glycoside hydrolase catalytic domain [Clostridia bacterium]|nr:family 78 glycoside hydrolase catalytic domain [Clostridia bacterium]